MGSSMIFEENQVLGYLPLRSYFENRKDQQSGQKKCPVEKEELVRSLIYRECLEELYCTYNHISKEMNVSELAITETYENITNDIFNQIDNLNSGSTLIRMKAKPLIVLDAQNVAMRHGLNQRFSCKGIEIAVQYW